MGGIHMTTLDEAGGQRQRHLRIIGVASKAPAYLGKITDLTVKLPDVAGRTALDGGTEDVAACSSQQAANTAVFMGRPRIILGDMAAAQPRSRVLDLGPAIAADTIAELKQGGVEL
jgi:hypothetical protein